MSSPEDPPTRPSAAVGRPGRPVVRLPVRASEASVAALTAALGRALSGEGPALLPVPDAASGTAPGAPPDDLPDLLPRALDDPADPTALLVPTSGSTGTPRLVALQASALLSSASATHDRLGGPGRWLLALPPHHVAGLQVVVRSLVARTPIGLLDPAGFTPDRFAAAAHDHLEAAAGRRCYLSLVPTQLVRLLRDEAAPALLARFDAVLVGGAAAPDAALAAARDAGVPVVTTYGMTETCGGCVYDGVALDGVTVAIEPSPAGGAAEPATGRVVLGGPMIARGYLGLGAEPADPRPPDGTTFLPPAADGTRRVRTSDLGRLDPGPDGRPRLRVLGRADDVVISGGANVAPAAVEALIGGLPAVAEVLVVGAPDPEWGQRVVAAVVPADPRHPPTLDDVRAAVAATLGAAAAPRQLVLLPALPLRGPGKPDRAAVRALAVGGPAAP